MSVDVWPGVLGLAVLSQDSGGNLIELSDQLEQRVVGHVLEGKLSLAGVARVGLSQHGMAKAGHHLGRGKEGEGEEEEEGGGEGE